MRRLLWLSLIPLLVGCRAARFQSHHAARGIHILGIGWIFESDRTNKIRVFGIGSVNAVRAEVDLARTNHPPAPPPL